MPRGLWSCDGPNCIKTAREEEAEDTWPQLHRPELRLRGDDTYLGGHDLVFHSDACLALWVRKHLIEARAQR